MELLGAPAHRVLYSGMSTEAQALGRSIGLRGYLIATALPFKAKGAIRLTPDRFDILIYKGVFPEPLQGIYSDRDSRGNACYLRLCTKTDRGWTNERNRSHSLDICGSKNLTGLDLTDYPQYWIGTPHRKEISQQWANPYYIIRGIEFQGLPAMEVIALDSIGGRGTVHRLYRGELDELIHELRDTAPLME